MPRSPASRTCPRSPPRPAPPTRGAELYVDLHLRSAARDRVRGRLHHRHRAPRLIRRNSQGLVPGEVVGEVSIEPVLVAAAQHQNLLMGGATIRGTHHL